MGDKTEKEKHKKDLQHDAKRLAAEHDKQEPTEAQHHPISGHPATAGHPASCWHHRREGEVGDQETRGLRRLRIACFVHSWVPTRQRAAPVLVQNVGPYLQ